MARLIGVSLSVVALAATCLTAAMPSLPPEPVPAAPQAAPPAAPQPQPPPAITMRWGLENTYSYRETMRAEDEDLRVRSNSPKKYRTFAFAADDPEAAEPYQACLQAHQRSWAAYQKTQKSSRTPGPAPGSEAARAHFRATFSNESPTCMAVFKQQAPTLFFDFTGDGAFTLERVEVKTIAFGQYGGGGLSTKESWTDLVLSHTPGWKPYPVEPPLAFTGNGRVRLRLWSDNFDPASGWATPMGEYLIEMTFVFSVGGREIRLGTGPFKIDV